MSKLSDWEKEIEEGYEIIKKKLEEDPNLKARLDGEMYRCKLLKEIEEEKEREKDREKDREKKKLHGGVYRRRR